MYASIFQHLPGRLRTRILILTVLVCAVVLTLTQVVFTWAAQLSPFTYSTIGANEPQ